MDKLQQIIILWGIGCTVAGIIIGYFFGQKEK